MRFAVLALLSACVDPVVPRVAFPTLDDGGASDNFVAVSAGREHTCGLIADGTAYCWGSNEFGQLGVPEDGTTCRRADRDVACRRRPVAVTGGLKFQTLSAGGAHTCGVALDYRLYCWGDNLRGALADPAVRRSEVPLPVLSTTLFMDVAAGGFHTCGLRTDGVVLCWGGNDFGQLGIASAGLGTAVPTAVATPLRFASVSAGERRTCGRASSGASYCWGETWVTHIGELQVTRSQTQPEVVSPAPVFKVLTVGASTTCGISLDNRAFCWEANIVGSIGDGSTDGSVDPRAVFGPLSFVAISSGATQTCAISDTGLAYCWGGAGSGQLGVPPSVVISRCGALKASCSTVPIQVSGWRVFRQIRAGLGDHVCGLTVGGNIYCWGAGRMGQRGDGRSTAEWSPVKTFAPL